MPNISIITTTYKHKDFIRYTIESVLSQTFSDWELLIGDDSPDTETREIVQEYVKKYPNKIKARHHRPNKWIVDNMNFLLSQVHEESEYISFLEWDDMYTPDNLEEKIKIFEKHQDVGFVYTDYKLIDISNRDKPIKRKNTSIKHWLHTLSLLQFLNMGNPIQSFGAVILKKSLLSDYLPLRNLDTHNKMFWPLDYSLWTKIVPTTSMYYLAKPLFLYRVHDNNFVKNVSLMNNQLELVYRDILKINKDPLVVNICSFFIAVNRMVSSFFAGNTLKTIEYGCRSFKYNKTKLFVYRSWIMILSLMPKYIKDSILNKFRS